MPVWKIKMEEMSVRTEKAGLGIFMVPRDMGNRRRSKEGVRQRLIHCEEYVPIWAWLSLGNEMVLPCLLHLLSDFEFMRNIISFQIIFNLAVCCTRMHYMTVLPLSLQ